MCAQIGSLILQISSVSLGPFAPIEAFSLGLFTQIGRCARVFVWTVCPNSGDSAWTVYLFQTVRARFRLDSLLRFKGRGLDRLPPISSISLGLFAHIESFSLGLVA